MAHSQDTRDTVRRLYIEGMPLNGAAITAGVSYDTARDWKAKAAARGDDWDTARSAYRISDRGIEELNKSLIEDFARQIITTTREIETAEGVSPVDKARLLSQMSDAYSKFSKAFGRINPQYSGLSVALDTLKVIVDHLKTQDPAALRALHPHLDAIGGLLGKRYG